jgi:hypothetical protein
MIRLLSLVAMMLMVSACNDIDGKMTVYADFMLVDEDGRHVTIPEGTHEAEFSYRSRKGEIEIEIKDIDNGKDRDFEFQVPDLSKEDFRKERLELHFPATAGDRELDTKMLITNKILSKEGPLGVFHRCREHGSVVYFWRPIVFYNTNRVTRVAAHIGSSENTLALFEATERKQGREVVWTGECGEEMPDTLGDVMVKVN